MTTIPCECDCSCEFGYDEGFAFWYEKVLTARKPYTCYECHETIQPGERYERMDAFDRDSERWEHYRTCLPCRRIRQAYCPTGFLMGGLDETLRECLGIGIRYVPDEEDDE